MEVAESIDTSIVEFQMTTCKKLMKSTKILELDQGMPMIGFCKPCKMACGRRYRVRA